MNIKTFIAVAVAALAVAACSEKNQESPVNQADVQLNADGSVATTAAENTEAPATETK